MGRRRAAGTLLGFALAGALVGCAGDDAGAASATGTTSGGTTTDAYGEGETLCVFFGTAADPLWEATLRELDDPPAAPRVTLDNDVCESERVLAVDITASGILYLAGWRAKVMSGKADPPVITPWVRSLGAAYDERWSKSFDPGSVSLTGLVADDGGVVVVGVRHDPAALPLGYAGAPWIAALSPEGALRWEDTLPGAGALRAVGQGPDGTLVAVGDVAVDAENTDLLAVGYSPAGAPLWSMTYDSAPFEAALDVAVDGLGRSWIVGVRAETSFAHRLERDEVYDEGSEWFRVPGWFPDDSTGLVALVDPAGGLQWIEVPATPDLFPYAWMAAVAVHPSGDVIVGGGRTSDTTTLARYDPDGALVWTTSAIKEGISALRVDDAGEIYAAGNGCRCMLKFDADGGLLATEPAIRSDAFALTPAGVPVIVDYVQDGWSYPPFPSY